MALVILGSPKRSHTYFERPKALQSAECNINASKVLYHNFLIYLTSAIAIKIDVKMELFFSLPRYTYTYSVKVRKLKVEFMTGGTWCWVGQ